MSFNPYESSSTSFNPYVSSSNTIYIPATVPTVPVYAVFAERFTGDLAEETGWFANHKSINDPSLRYLNAVITGSSNYASYFTLENTRIVFKPAAYNMRFKITASCPVNTVGRSISQLVWTAVPGDNVPTGNVMGTAGYSVELVQSRSFIDTVITPGPTQTAYSLYTIAETANEYSYGRAGITGGGVPQLFSVIRVEML